MRVDGSPHLELGEPHRRVRSAMHHHIRTMLAEPHRPRPRCVVAIQGAPAIADLSSASGSATRAISVPSPGASSRRRVIDEPTSSPNVTATPRSNFVAGSRCLVHPGRRAGALKLAVVGQMVSIASF